MASTTLEELERKVSADPRNADLRHLLGAQYAEEGQFELASRELLQAVTLNPAAHTAPVAPISASSLY